MWFVVKRNIYYIVVNIAHELIVMIYINVLFRKFLTFSNIDECNLVGCSRVFVYFKLRLFQCIH